MYLKQQRVDHHRHYVLCESYRDRGCWRSRRLMDLGPDPEQHIVYPGGNSFYVKESIEDRLREKAAAFSSDELEKLFMPFIDPRIRRIVEQFERPVRRTRGRDRLGRDGLFKKQKKLHPFDKRRLHYLRCGRVNIGNLDARPWKFLNVLMDKSRDELETLLHGMERALPPHEIPEYLYTALHMQGHFRHLLTRHQPAFLDPEKVDHYLVEDLCRLNRDPAFFKGVARHDPDALHPYLIRYLILYFDNPFDVHRAWGETVKDFIWQHRFYRPPPSRPRPVMAETEACQCLGISIEDFKKMDRKGLIRWYRQLAKKTHPDQGGDEATFIRITAAYEELLRIKG
ncbi:MAG: J domain-containing protein [Deltaproteobacteria bacterium]|nr:J domain-containing protein [Deltaproteobacteria bacterium]